MRTILIVDDEKSIRQTLEGVLQDEGFKTLTAETGEDCLCLLKEETPDLILLDIWMPGIDGLETLKRDSQPEPRTDGSHDERPWHHSDRGSGHKVGG